MNPKQLRKQPDLYFNPFTVMQSSTIGGTLFSEYLYENMLNFYNDLDDLSAIMSRYSRTQEINEEIPFSYFHSQEIEQIKTVVGISRSIGVMHDNIHSYPEGEDEASQGRKRTGLFQLVKPKFTSMRQERIINEQSLGQLQKDLARAYGMNHSISQISTDLLPYCQLIAPEYRSLSEFEDESTNQRNQYVANAVEDLGIHSEDQGRGRGGVIRGRKLSEVKELEELFEEVEDSEEEEEEEVGLTIQDLKLIESD